MLDYKDIIIKHYALGMSGQAIAATLSEGSKSGVNRFLAAFKACGKLSYPLPEGITNYGIAAAVYGVDTTATGRDFSYELPDYEAIEKDMSSRKNMTLKVLWNRYVKRCRDSELKFYSYRQFCENYAKWCEENKESLHFNAVIGQKMEVDFAGKTFHMTDPLTGEALEIVVFVAILPYSQFIYAEGMVSTKEPQWIAVNNNALAYFGGVPALVVCDNCKQAVIANRDWISPELNKDYAEWAEHNHTVILPAKVRKPRYKSSVENAVGILEKGIFHDMEEMDYFSLERFNRDLWNHLDKLNRAPFTKKPHSRRYYWEEERQELQPLPATPYEYMERRTAKVSSDYHVRFDNAYYSVDRAYLHKEVLIRASATTVKIFSKEGIAKAIGIAACTTYRAEYHHCESLLEALVALKAQDYTKYQKRLKKICGTALLILDDFLLHTITDEREVKILFEILEKRCEMNLSTIICSQREPASWSAMILNDEVSANAILKRATKHYTVVIKPQIND